MKLNKLTTKYLNDIKATRKAQNEALKKKARAALKGLFLIASVGGALVTGSLYGLVVLTEFYNTNTIVFRKPFDVTRNRVVTIMPRETEVVLSEKTQKVAEIVKDEENKELATYICEKWGVVECKTALAVAKAESEMNCNAFNVNTNGSIDLGVFQLNSNHLTKGGEWTLTNMADCHRNVDLAYEMWEAQGWTPWVAYKTGAYIAQLAE